MKLREERIYRRRCRRTRIQKLKKKVFRNLQKKRVFRSCDRNACSDAAAKERVFRQSCRGIRVTKKLKTHLYETEVKRNQREQNKILQKQPRLREAELDLLGMRVPFPPGGGGKHLFSASDNPRGLI